MGIMRLDVDPKDTGSIPVMLVVGLDEFLVYVVSTLAFCREELVRVQQNSLNNKTLFLR